MTTKNNTEDITQFVLFNVSKLSNRNKDKIKLSDNLFKDLNLDSLNKLDIILTMEHEYNICFQESDEINLNTVEDIINTSNRLKLYEEQRCKLSMAV